MCVLGFIQRFDCLPLNCSKGLSLTFNNAPIKVTQARWPAPSRSLRAADQLLLVVPKSWLKHGRDLCSYRPQTPELPLHVWLAPTLPVLNSILKHMFIPWLLTPYESCLFCFIAMVSWLLFIVFFVLFYGFMVFAIFALVNCRCF